MQSHEREKKNLPPPFRPSTFDDVKFGGWGAWHDGRHGPDPGPGGSLREMASIKRFAPIRLGSRAQSSTESFFHSRCACINSWPIISMESHTHQAASEICPRVLLIERVGAGRESGGSVNRTGVIASSDILFAVQPLRQLARTFTSSCCN